MSFKAFCSVLLSFFVVCSPVKRRTRSRSRSRERKKKTKRTRTSRDRSLERALKSRDIPRSRQSDSSDEESDDNSK